MAMHDVIFDDMKFWYFVCHDIQYVCSSKRRGIFNLLTRVVHFNKIFTEQGEVLWVQYPLEATFCWNFLKPLDVNSGLKGKCDLIVINSNTLSSLSLVMRTVKILFLHVARTDKCNVTHLVRTWQIRICTIQQASDNKQTKLFLQVKTKSIDWLTMEKIVILLMLVVAVHGMPRIHISGWNKEPPNDIQPFIRNGQDADVGEWPWQVIDIIDFFTIRSNRIPEDRIYIRHALMILEMIQIQKVKWCMK